MIQDGGAFSAYLIGTYEKRAGVGTILQIINPTVEEPLEVVVAFYDDNEKLQTRLTRQLGANDMWEIVVHLCKASNQISGSSKSSRTRAVNRPVVSLGSRDKSCRIPD